MRAPQSPVPGKLDSLCLEVRPCVRKIMDCLPDDNVPDKLLIRRAVEGLELITARIKGIVYSRLMLRDQKTASRN